MVKRSHLLAVATQILERVSAIGLDITEERNQGHLDFELNVRKRLRKNVHGQYLLLGGPPKMANR